MSADIKLWVDPFCALATNGIISPLTSNGLKSFIRSLGILAANGITVLIYFPLLSNLLSQLRPQLFSDPITNSSPFDETAVDLLESLDAPAYKIASFELVDLPLIAYIARLKKPMLMSTGMSSMSEIADAIETAKTNGCSQIAIFHCISSYPAPLAESNLRAIKLLQQEFDVEVGLSDHTLGPIASIVSTSLGATVIEKHFTLARADGGVDSAFSIEPNEMAALVQDVSAAHASLGVDGSFRSNAEGGNKNFRRSLYFIADIKEGTIITNEHIKRIRPGFGLAPKFLPNVLGKKTTRDIKRGDRVTTCSFA